jgi:hypothetical protein
LLISLRSVHLLPDGYLIAHFTSVMAVTLVKKSGDRK